MLVLRRSGRVVWAMMLLSSTMNNVPLAFDAVGGVVVVDGCLAAVLVVAVDGLLYEVLGVGGWVGFGGGCWGFVFVPAGSEDEAVVADDPGVFLAVLADGGVENT